MGRNPVVGSFQTKIVIVFVFIFTYFIFSDLCLKITPAQENAVSQMAFC